MLSQLARFHACDLAGCDFQEVNVKCVNSDPFAALAKWNEEINLCPRYPT
jgi:formate dehydrogenase maturation protein FdhE